MVTQQGALTARFLRRAVVAAIILALIGWLLATLATSIPQHRVADWPNPTDVFAQPDSTQNPVADLLDWPNPL